MSELTISPSISDRIRARDAFPAPTPDPALRRFAVRVEHVKDGGETTDHVVIAEMTQSAASRTEGDVGEYVRRYVERVGNRFPNDGSKLKNLHEHEPLVIDPAS